MRIPDHLTCLLRNLYVDQEATVRSLQGTTDWIKIGKGVWQGCILSPYFSYVQSTSCDIPGWKNHKLESRFPGETSTTSLDDTTLMAKSEEELKHFLMKVKEESEKVGLKLDIQKMKIMASGPTISWQIDGENSDRFYFLGHQNHCRWWLQPWN